MKRVKQTTSANTFITRQVTHVFAICVLLITTNVSATTQNLIQDQIHQYIKTQIEPNPNKKIEIIVNPIDKRKKLASCPMPISIILAGKRGLSRNNTVKAECDGLWKLYVAVRVITHIPIVSATENLSPGTLLSKKNLSITYFDQSALRGEVSYDIDKIVGSRAKRYVQQGRPLLSNQVCMVCKGDRVTMYVNNASLSIKSSGTALTDGSLGQTIAARNTSSGRRVEGKVIAVGQIEIK